MTPRTPARLLALLVSASIVLAACGDDGEDGGDAAEDQGPTGPATVGLIYTVSGQGGEFAQAALGTAEIVRADAAEDGIELTVESFDYAGEPKRALAGARQLADQGVAGIVVATDDPDVAAALEGFDEVPLMYALISEDAAVRDNPAAFRMAASNRLQARKIAAYLVEEREYERIAILHEATAFGREGARDLEAEIRPLGAEIVLRSEFKVGGDIHTPVTHAGQLGAQALIVWAQNSGEAGRITIEAHRMAQSYQLVLSGNLATESYGKNAASQVVPTAFRDGILSVGTWAGPWYAEVPKIGSFFSRFRSEQSALAPVQATQIYDSVLLLARVAAEAGDGGSESVTEAIESTEDFEGVGVPVSFGPDDREGVGIEDMAMWGFTRKQESDGGEFFPEVDTGGGFFTIIPRSANIPEKYNYLLQGLPGG